MTAEKMIEVVPLKDFHIFQPPKYDIKLFEGKKIKVPKKFKENLVSENVIKKEVKNGTV